MIHHDIDIEGRITHTHTYTQKEFLTSFEIQSDVLLDSEVFAQLAAYVLVILCKMNLALCKVFAQLTMHVFHYVLPLRIPTNSSYNSSLVATRLL